MEHTAICGSDLHLYHGDIEATGVRLGHEFIGTVAEAGPEVRTLRVGDRVLVSGLIGCGHCDACASGDPVLCRNGGLTIFGTTPGLPGGQAEAVAVPLADMFALPIPESIDDEQAVSVVAQGFQIDNQVPAPRPPTAARGRKRKPSNIGSASVY